MVKLRWILPLALGTLLVAGCGQRSDADVTPTSEAGGGTLSTLLNGATDQTYTAKYDLEAQVAALGTKGELTITSKPPRYAGNVVFSDAAAGFGGLTLITDGTNAYTCLKIAGSGSCTKQDTQSSDSNFNILDVKKLVADAEKNADLKEVDGRTFAGHDSRCFSGTAQQSNDERTVCLDKSKGVPTFVQTPSVKMTLTNLTGSVDDKAFEPPYSVR
jgi:hypothetical protein